jgi:hypothetical protein
MPGGVAGLQNQSGGRKVPGGFDSLPSPPHQITLLQPKLCSSRKPAVFLGEQNIHFRQAEQSLGYGAK